MLRSIGMLAGPGPLTLACAVLAFALPAQAAGATPADDLLVRLDAAASRAQALREVARRGASAVPLLTQELERRGRAGAPTARIEPLLLALSEVRQHAGDSAPLLLELAGTATGNLQVALVQTLADVAPFAADDDLQAALQWGWQALPDLDPRTRRGTPNALRDAVQRLLVRAEAARCTDGELQAILRLQTETNGTLRGARAIASPWTAPWRQELACDVLAARGAVAAKFVDELSRLYADCTHPAVDTTLQLHGEQERVAVTSCKAAAAARAILAIAPASLAAHAVWCDRLVGIDRERRLEALTVLLGAAPDADLVPLLRRQLRTASPTVLGEALQLVACLGPAAAAAAPELEALAAVNDRAAAALAQQALRRIRGER